MDEALDEGDGPLVRRRAVGVEAARVRVGGEVDHGRRRVLRRARVAAAVRLRELLDAGGGTMMAPAA